MMRERKLYNLKVITERLCDSHVALTMYVLQRKKQRGIRKHLAAGNRQPPKCVCMYDHHIAVAY